MSDDKLSAFKAYDIRGKVPDDLNENMAYDIGRAYVAEMKPDGAVAVGRDIRPTSRDFSRALIRGLTDSGADVVDIGLCGTEMVYFASALDGMGGGVMITASHNPRDYNGLKLVRREGRPVSADTGLMDIERRVRTGDLPGRASTKGSVEERDIMEPFIERILSFIDVKALKPLKILANPGNGCAGPALDMLFKRLPFVVERMHFEPDGTFPAGIPNPLLVENRADTANAVISSHAALGIAWDGDYDRCFFFDETGRYIEGYYLVGFLAKRVLSAQPGGSIVLDPRLTWNTLDIVESVGGTAIVSKSGHSFIKEKMRETGALYGGEMSAHHYFREFTYCDSGMIPWLLIAEELSMTGQPFSSLVEERMRLYPCSGEINRTVADSDAVIARLLLAYGASATSFSDLDGVSFEFGDAWRFNLRKSNTEPVVRLNVESSGDERLMQAKTDEILAIIDAD